MTMENPETPASRSAVAQRAADFLMRRRFWDWSDADQAELDAWLAESDFHQAAWLRLSGGAAEIERIAAIRPFEPAIPRERSHIFWMFIPVLVAASVALLVTVGIPYVRALMEPPPERVFGTNVGGRALLKFSDGTEIELNTNTAVRYRMTTKERTVWLERGEAYFRVAHNKNNPFAVMAAGHRITDLGTEFLVREDAAALDVVLVRGRAQLASENAGVPVAMLAPGDEAVATHAATTVTKKTPQELSDELAWRRGVLVFRNKPLADAVREFNNYNETKLVIADPSIAQLRFSAEVRTDDYEDFLRLAETVLDLRDRREGNDILISRAPAKAKKTKAASAR